MRNLNTSFVKNAIRFFANEASHVLRALIDPATTLLRLIQSTVRNICEYALPASYRLTHIQQVSPAVVYQGTSEIVDRIDSVMAGNDLSGEHGNRRWNCPKRLTVS